MIGGNEWKSEEGVQTSWHFNAWAQGWWNRGPAKVVDEVEMCLARVFGPTILIVTTPIPTDSKNNRI